MMKLSQCKIKPYSCPALVSLFNKINVFDIFQQQMNRQRQYRQDRSPIRDQFEIEEHTYRMKEILKSDLSMLEEENAILKLKCKKVSELEEKVDLVLKQNSQLLSENQKMSRYLHQQKIDNDQLRNKCESLSSQKMGVVGQFQLQRKKLLKQLQNLGDELAEVEALKQAQINEIKSKYQIELQSLKRQFHNSEDSFEIEIRKLKEQLDKREKQIADYANRLKRVSTETDYQILKLKEQKEKLKSELIYNDDDHSKEVQALRAKLQNNYLEEIEAVKRNHLNNLQEVEEQNARLREGLDERNKEFDQLNQKLNKQRVYYEDTINFLKRDNDGYRAKIIETQKFGQMQIGQLKNKLQQLHDAEIDELRMNQQAQLQAMENEMHRQEAIIHGKNQQIEQLIKDKTTTRNLFDSELLRVKDQYSALLQKHKDLEQRFGETTYQGNNRLADREKHIQYLQDLIKSQKANAQTQNNSFQKIIQNLKQELSIQKMNSQQVQQSYKEQISNVKHQLNELKNNSQQKESDYQRLVNELKTQLNGTSNQLNTKADALNSKNKIVEKQNQGLKNNITLKQKQIKNLFDRLKSSSERQTKLQNEIDDLRNKMIKKQQKSNQSILEQKNRMDNSFAYAIQNLKSDHQSALRLQANKYRDLQDKLRKKQAELEQLLRLYKKMTDQIQVLTEQQANKKDITLKFPGATADLIATKNLFDVYLKTKVLDVCGDALKQNKTS